MSLNFMSVPDQAFWSELNVKRWTLTRDVGSLSAFSTYSILVRFGSGDPTGDCRASRANSTTAKMSSTTPAVFKIIPTTQKYDWGKIGASSKVAQFAFQSRIPGFKIDERSPYAEVFSSVSTVFWTAGWYPHKLWMGTHPTSPSLVLSSREVLSKHLASHSYLIGEPIVKKFNAGNGNLPFLFKVLSIEKALSIQTHPDKKTAEILHAEHPNIYKGM